LPSLISVHVGMNISGANRTHLALTFIWVVVIGQSFAPLMFIPTWTDISREEKKPGKKQLLNLSRKNINTIHLRHCTNRGIKHCSGCFGIINFFNVGHTVWFPSLKCLRMYQNECWISRDVRVFFYCKLIKLTTMH
jgi:hypothetical protein